MNLDEFLALARPHGRGMAPVFREILADTLTPVLALLRLRAQGAPVFLLESVEGGEKIGRWSFLGTRPYRQLTARGPNVVDSGPDGEVRWTREGNFFSILEQEIDACRAVPVERLPPFTGGAVGYIGYDAVRWIERIPDRHRRDVDLPEASFHFYDTVVAFDHGRHRILLLANADLSGVPGDGAGRPAAQEKMFREAQARLDRLELVLRTPAAGEESPGRLEKLAPLSIAQGMRSNFTRAAFLQAVESAKEYIAAGDAFQIVLSQRFEREVSADPFAVYRILRALNPSPYLFYLQWGETALFGSSPETLVRVEGRTVSVRPIAGTRKRGETPQEDQVLEADLLADEKELAEHRMLVDLGRNDVGRVARFGTVKLPRYLTIERYSHVMHIVSEVTGELRQGLTALDALQAGFPAGTVSGAPKIRAMEIIDELEPTRRGIYAGAVGYLDFAGNLDTCIAIRTILIHRGVARIQAGAGLVADSVPEKEYMETVHKAAALFEAIRLAEAGLAERTAAAQGSRGEKEGR